MNLQNQFEHDRETKIQDDLKNYPNEEGMALIDTPKDNPLFRKFINDNETIYDVKYLCFDQFYNFTVYIGKSNEFDDVIYYSVINFDGSLSRPTLQSELDLNNKR